MVLKVILPYFLPVVISHILKNVLGLKQALSKASVTWCWFVICSNSVSLEIYVTRHFSGFKCRIVHCSSYFLSTSIKVSWIVPFHTQHRSLVTKLLFSWLVWFSLPLLLDAVTTPAVKKKGSLYNFPASHTWNCTNTYFSMLTILYIPQINAGHFFICNLMHK